MYAFPLEGQRFLCTQGFNGHFTHFFPGTYHALDLAYVGFFCHSRTVVAMCFERIINLTSVLPGADPEEVLRS